MDRHMIRMSLMLNRDLALARDELEAEGLEFEVALWSRETVFPEAIRRELDRICRQAAQS